MVRGLHAGSCNTPPGTPPADVQPGASNGLLPLGLSPEVREGPAQPMVGSQPRGHRRCWALLGAGGKMPPLEQLFLGGGAHITTPSPSVTCHSRWCHLHNSMNLNQALSPNARAVLLRASSCSAPLEFNATRPPCSH